jgi:hypothetical protein
MMRVEVHGSFMTYKPCMFWISYTANVRPRRRGVQNIPRGNTLCWLNVIWPNAASTPAPTQRRFNESRSLEPRQTEDIKRYAQASTMMIAAQTVPVSGNLKTWFTGVGEHHENRQTIMCYGSILQEGCECEGHFMRSGRNSQRNIRNRSFTAHGLARYLTIMNDFNKNR